jgi:nitrogen fixation protein FixH
VIKGLPGIIGLGVVASMAIAACGPSTTSGNEPPESAAATAGTSEGVAIDFRSDPDPLKTGDNTIEVTVRETDGSPVTDASVTAVFSMPAMPTMNMPAMRAEAPLTHVEAGRYRGTGQLSMSGTWNVAVTASREGQPIGRRTFSIVAK